MPLAAPVPTLPQKTGKDGPSAHVIPEDSWFIFPLSHILGSTAVTLSPKRRRKRHCNDPYREAWHYLHEPDGLEFAVTTKGSAL
jgi:hypothetical protein